MSLLRGMRPRLIRVQGKNLGGRAKLLQNQEPGKILIANIKENRRKNKLQRNLTLLSGCHPKNNRKVIFQEEILEINSLSPKVSSNPEVFLHLVKMDIV